MNTQMTPGQLKTWFDSDEFRTQYHCDAPLGCWLDSAGTHFALWAPTAQTVQLNLYRSGNGDDLTATHPLTKGEKGLWTADFPQRLDGAYYDYNITVDGETSRTMDPYAKACGVNGQRGMVLDLRTTDPAGWDKDAPPAKPAEDIIYELHVKDFSWDEHSGVDAALRGKFLALCQSDTTLDGKGEIPTCLNHVKRLGATHIQLMPVYDYCSVDEAGAPDAFNWGYDPANYNIPEGTYATDPYHGEVRIREMKQVIQSLHKNGFRVVMDVVYNHTFHLKSCLFRTAPWYFYRQCEDGSASNGSGCGSELASERSMCARYILDSVRYWAEEYHIDGFRFDLMGMLDTELMNNIRHMLDERFGEGEKLLYGEPWAGGQCHPRPGTNLTHKGNLWRLDKSIGAFCDGTRDAIKGSVMDEGSRGFVNGGGLDAYALAECLNAWPHGGFDAASQCITYLSAHDDWTLWDKLTCTMDSSRTFTGTDAGVLRANRLAFAMLSCCRGHLFLLSGEEFARTKQGVKNSYNSPLSINQMDWQRCASNSALVDYYRGLIALRQQLPALCDKSPADHLRVVRQLDQDAAGYLVDNGEGSTYPQLLLCFNASDKGVHFDLPDGRWAVLADGVNSFLWRSPQVLTAEASLPPMSALILGEVKA